MTTSLQAVQDWAKESRKTHLLSSFKVFARESGMVPDYAPGTHDEMCDEMESQIPELITGRKQKKKVYLAPRGTFKSTLVIALIVFCVLKWPSIRIVLARAKHEESKQMLFEVKHKGFFNPIVLELWGNIEERAHLWNEESIQIGTRKEPTIDTAGLDISKTGQHPDMVFIDDIINDKNYRSIAIMAQARRVVMAFYPVLEPWGSILVTGTRWAANDVYGWLLAEIEEDLRDGHEPSWTSYVRSAYRADGGLFFPERLSEAQLERNKRDLRSDPRMFSAWYLNQPYDDDTKLFRAEYLVGKYFVADFYATPFPVIDVHITDEDGNFSGESFQVPVEITMTLDPALTTNRRSDSTGVTVVGCDAESNWWILIAKQYKAVPSVVADNVLRWIGAFQPRVCLIESAQADAGMVSRIQDGIRDLGVRTEITSYHVLRDEKKGERGKAGRIEALEPLFREGKVYVHRGACDAFLEQYNAWPDVDHDDVVDALAMQRRVVIPSRHSTIEDAEGELEDDPDEDADAPWNRQKPVRNLIARVGRSSQALRA